ncbi:hypothetical protein BDF19DRAFT_495691 [Syncephalis fuscata]|nr:hypothetical protein BDF19DRAFT_495691 [Syncephalis fuscata]
MALWARGMGRDPMDSMDTALGRAFHDFWTNPSSMMRRGAGDMMGGDSEMRSWCPAIDVCDEPNRMVVHAELPGVKKQDIKLELHDDNIQICGETKYQAEYNREICSARNDATANSLEPFHCPRTWMATMRRPNSRMAFYASKCLKRRKSIQKRLPSRNHLI